MKVLSILLILLGSLSAFAWSYQYQPRSKYNGLDLYEISLELKKNSLSEMDRTRAGRLPGLNFDQLFINPLKTDDYAFVILDLIAPEQESVLKLDGGRLVCHSKTSQGRSFAIFFSKEIYGRGISYCVPPMSSMNAASKLNLIRLMLPQASAEVFCGALVPSTATMINQSLNVVMVGSEWILQKVGTCVAQALQSGAGTLEGFGNGLKNLIDSPLALWDRISEQAAAVKNFVVHIGAEVKTLIKNFNHLDGELIMSSVCSLAGETIVGGLLSGGIVGMTAKLGLTIAKLSLHLQSLSKVLSKLSELKKKGRNDLAHGVLSCGI